MAQSELPEATLTQEVQETESPTSTSEPTETVEQAFTPEVTLPDGPAPTEAETLTPVPVETPMGGGAQFAFVSERSGIPQIWLMASSGGEATQITNLSDGACQPDWSPDGKRLVVVSPCRARQDQYKGSSLFLVNADGTGLTPLMSVPGGDFDPAWSPDGSTIAFTSLRNRTFPHIYLYDLASNSVKKLADSSSSDRRPAWSPDGKKMAFETTRGGQGGVSIYLMDADGNNVRPFSNEKAGLATMPSWSPNGSIIVFSRGNNYLLAEKQSTGRSIDDDFVISQTNQNIYNAKVSPDNFWILYGGIKKGLLDIYLMTMNGGSIMQLTDLDGGASKDYSPVWRPAEK
jgi:Tol biopolymer transport system component